MDLVRLISVTEIKMAPIEVEKMLTIMELRHSFGYNQFELSFLLGQRDHYVRDVEFPNLTLDYPVPHYNYLAMIFNCGFNKIIPVYKSESDFPIYRLSSATDESGKIYYQLEKANNNCNWKAIKILTEEQKDLLLDSPSKFTKEDILNWVDKKLQAGYFKQPKTALELLKACQKDLKGPVRPMYLSAALVSYAKKKLSSKIVKKKNEMARFEYSMEV